MVKTPLIIDTDFTKDDVIAIAMAANCGKFDIKAITCYGEWFVETVALRDSLGLDCPVCWGAMKPLFRQQQDMDIYGNMEADFNGNTKIGTKDEEYPWDKIYAEAVKAQGTLEIVTLGPLTNIALAILRYPQIKPLIKQIFCFAGSGYEGNAAPYSEYNAYTDPDALKAVFESGIKVTMCGLDAIAQCAVSAEKTAHIHPINETVKDVLDSYIKGAEGEFSVPAAAALSCYMSNSECTVKEYYVAVETKGTLALGQTVVDRLGKYKRPANIKVILDSSAEQFVQNLEYITK